MIRNLIVLGCTMLLAFGLSLGAFAGSVSDADGDGVPDEFDNCVDVQNGPLGGTCAQGDDADNDGYGNPCDFDYNNNGVVDPVDLGDNVLAQGSGDPVIDTNCNGVVDPVDLGDQVLAQGSGPGPSGLACAGTVPCP
ncbi:MAG: hypothetical protein JRG92_10885 [Deltaproteobacteria bacterium]|nr:hypothetical protein [Deltaproteobacteria bacterium]MBW2384131.1 hypothetical protein [Deltaproteobacteria bacterium]MBW2697615.1 hypothetical protein [Deltaproteobacteria bacterium]